MAWQNTRSTIRQVGTARTVAHADDAKSRADEASQLARRGFPRKLIIGGAAAAVLVVMVTAALVAASTGGDDKTPQAAAPSATPSATEVAEESPAAVLEGSQPSGEWRAQIIGTDRLLRDGTRQPESFKDKPTRWTFTGQTCTDTGCVGQIASTSGLTFPYTWDGTTLVVERGGVVNKGDKVACVDTESGETVPIEEAAAIDTYTYHFGPFTGTPENMTSKVKVKVSTEFFGTCKPTPKDTVGFTEKQVITRVGAG